MAYTFEEAEKLLDQLEQAQHDLRELLQRSIVITASELPRGAKEHLAHGVGRRLGVISLSQRRIYELFPPSTTSRLPAYDLDDLQVYLQAFVMNVSGIFENWAWAFIFRHGLEETLRKPRDRSDTAWRSRVGLFKPETLELLPVRLRDYVNDPNFRAWHTRYLKNFRDSLAHRIPLYIPPMALTDEESALYEQLEQEKVEALRIGDAVSSDRLAERQDALGAPFFGFLQSIWDDEGLGSIGLHTQALSDAKTVVEFGNLFYDHWHEREAASR